MQGLWLEKGRLQFRTDLPEPQPGDSEALVRVLRAGICGTDLEMLRGYVDFTGVLGHEFVGRVEAAPGAPEWVGRRVAAEINVSCGACSLCGRGQRTHCERRTVVGIRGHDGVFAERVVLPVENLHAVPDALSDEQAVFTEPAAAALRIGEQLPLGPSERVVVIGAGRLGLLVAQAVAATGCRLSVVARHAEARKRIAALGLHGVAYETLPARAADVVIDCTGHPEALEQTRRLVRPGGTLVLKSTYHGQGQVDLTAVVVDELTLMGSRCGPFPAALEALSQGILRVKPLLEATYPLSDGLPAFEHAARPGALKILLAP